MVYDERNNFVGDSHWKGTEFEEGEELQLERGGILIEVGECIGKKEQDLTELVDKRVHAREEREAAKTAYGSPARPQGSFSRTLLSTPGPVQLRPKSLNAVIGTPSGHYGRAAISALSPYKQNRQANQDENINGRPAKRQRIEPPSKSGYAQNLMGSTLDLGSSRPPSTATIRYEALKVTIDRSRSTMVDLTSDDGGGYENAPRKSPPRVEKRKVHRSPPSRSGYASSLTGASLNLATSSSYVSKPLKSGLGVMSQKPGRNFGEESEPLSSFVETSLMSSDPPSDLSTSLSKKKDKVKIPGNSKSLRVASAHHSRSHSPVNATKKPTAVPPEKAKQKHPKELLRENILETSKVPPKASLIDRLRSSSPVTTTTRQQAKSPTEKAKVSNVASVPRSHPSSSVEKSREVSLSTPSASTNAILCSRGDQPVSTLRIKSRPRQKMMMLMEVPASRSSSSHSLAPSESFSSGVSKETVVKERPGGRDLAGARIMGQHSPPMQQLSSSPMDRGIDHRKIDALLARRRPSIESQSHPYQTSTINPQNLLNSSLISDFKHTRTHLNETEVFPPMQENQTVEQPPSSVIVLAPVSATSPSMPTAPAPEKSSLPEKVTPLRPTLHIPVPKGPAVEKPPPAEEVLLSKNAVDSPSSSKNSAVGKPTPPEELPPSKPISPPMLPAPAIKNGLQQKKLPAPGPLCPNNSNTFGSRGLGTSDLKPTSLSPNLETTEPPLTTLLGPALASVETPRTESTRPVAKLANPATRGPSISITASKTVDKLTTPIDQVNPTPPPPTTNRSSTSFARGQRTTGICNTSKFSLL